MSDRQYTAEEIEAAISGAPIEGQVEEEPTPAEEAVEESPEPEAPAEPEAEPEAEAEPEPQEDDLEEKLRKVQAAKDREVAAMQKELQRLREEMAEERGRREALAEHQQTESTAASNAVTAEDLQHGIQTNLAGTFEWTVTNRPDLVHHLISMVRETEGLGNPVADQMVVEYTEYKHQLAEQKLEERYKAIEQAREAEQAPLRTRQAMEEVIEGLTERFGENFAAVQEEIGNRLNTQGREYVNYLMEQAVANGEDPESVVTPELLKEMVVDIYLELREESFNQQAAAPAKPAPVPAAAAAIGGTATTPPPVDDNDEFLASFITGAKEANITVNPDFLP